MMKALKPRAMRRLLLFMAVIFPIVYLCGSLFFALGGSHGDFSWHDNSLVQPLTYEEAMQVDNFSYGDWNWENEHGKRVGFSLGYYYAPSVVGDFNIYFRFGLYGVGTSLYSYDDSFELGDFVNYGLGYESGNSILSFDIYNVLNETVLEVNHGLEHTYCCFYATPNDSLNSPTAFVFLGDSLTSGFSIYFYDSNGFWADAYAGLYNFDDFSNSWNFYFDDGSNMPQGVQLSDYLLSYFVPTLKPVESDSLADYMWSKPFGDNFVSDLGKGVINGNNNGFAPMNTLFHTINDNVLHFSEDDALAMFGFGYVYYAVNVLVIYEVVVLAVKLIMLPLKAVDAIGVNREGD